MYFIYLDHNQTDIAFWSFQEAEQHALEIQSHGCTSGVSIYFEDQEVITYLPLNLGVA